MKEISKLLIAYDGSACSDAALDDLKRAGLPDKVEALVMTVAYVFLPPESEVPEDEVVSQTAAAMIEETQEDAERAVSRAREVAQSAADRVKEVFPDWTVLVEAYGDSPAWAVIKQAVRLHTDLIVVGSHHHKLIGGRLIMGSVSQRVLHEAPCSVRVARCSSEPRKGPIRIVVGFDGSQESNLAIDAVASRAWPAGSEVRVVTAHKSLKEEEHAVQEKLRTAGLIASQVRREGQPEHVLLEEAEQWDADSIFVGTRDLHGLRHLLQGSVSAAVAAHAKCSVEVVRPGN